MNVYIISIHARWAEWDEHPLGRRPDIVRPKSKSLIKRFKKPNDKSAKKEAERIIVEFSNKLPKEKKGRSGNTKPKIKLRYLARII